MSELSCDTPFIGRNETLDLSRYLELNPFRPFTDPTGTFAEDERVGYKLKPSVILIKNYKCTVHCTLSSQHLKT